MSVVYDALDRLESPNFFIGMNIQGAPATPPPARQMRSFLAQKLKSLDPDQVAQTQDRSAIPMWDYEHAGWRIEFFPIPKSVDARGEPGVRPLGYWQYGPYSLTSREAIKEAITSKGNSYGTLDQPYVVAVDALGGGIDRNDEFYALFGDEQWILQKTATGAPKVELARKSNGAWTSESGPRYTRVSTALLVRGAICWRVPDAPVCLYHNPWAAQPYTAELNRLPRAVFKSNTMEWLDGETLSDIFGLPLGWPEVE
jgi:hypothetical protein